MTLTRALPAVTPDSPPSSLPTPPSDAEKYSYFRRQHRWLLGVQALSFALIAWSVLRFATADRRLLLFLVPMTLYGVTLVVSLLSGTRRRRTDLIAHRRLVLTWRPPRTPSVDVFLPTAGEPLDVLANTYRHVAALRWDAPLEVTVLDDAARAEVRALAEEHGFTYRTRPDRGRLKKAGNLRHGYENTAHDLIVIFDADFSPRADFLESSGCTTRWRSSARSTRSTCGVARAPSSSRSCRSGAGSAAATSRCWGRRSSPTATTSATRRRWTSPTRCTAAARR